MSRIQSGGARSCCPLRRLAGGLFPRTRTHFKGMVEGEFVYLASSQSGALTQLAVAQSRPVQADTPLFENSNRSMKPPPCGRRSSNSPRRRSQLADLQTGKRVPGGQRQSRATRRIGGRQRPQGGAATHAGPSAVQPQAAFQKRSSAIRAPNAEATVGARLRQLTNQVEVARLPGRSQQIAAQRAQVAAAEAVVAQAQWKLDQKRVARARRQARLRHALSPRRVGARPAARCARLLPPQNIKVRLFVPETRNRAHWPPGRRSDRSIATAAQWTLTGEDYLRCE